MGCNCGGNRAAAALSKVSGTYRVMVNGRKVYETSNPDAADTVADRFPGSTILKPGEIA